MTLADFASASPASFRLPNGSEPPQLSSWAQTALPAQLQLPSLESLLATAGRGLTADGGIATEGSSRAGFSVASGGAGGSGNGLRFVPLALDESGGLRARVGIDWAALGIGSEQYEAALLTVRVASVSQLYGYLPFIGHEIAQASFFIDDPEVSSKLIGTWQQLSAIGLFAQGSERWTLITYRRRLRPSGK